MATYLVKDYSGCVCESFWRFNLDSLDLGDGSPVCVWASSNLVKEAGNLLSLPGCL